MERIREFATNHLVYYLWVVVIVIGTTGVIWFFRASLSIQVIALLYLLPVVFCSRLWGLGPGILAAFASFLNLNFFFLPPLYTFVVHNFQDFLALIVFLVIAVVISQLLGQDQANIETAKAREREATLLYEFSVGLVGLLDEKSIAQIMAGKICETFHAEKVEVILRQEIPGGALVCLSPGLMNQLPIQAAVSLPLLTPRGQYGSVQVWRGNRPFTHTEEQLLKTFTTQGALAIERADFAQLETHAKVLEESDRLKSALLSSVSHELRSPLATIKASISSLRSGTVDWDSEARQDLLSAVEEETDHLNQLVGNLLDMSRIETGELKPQRKWNSLAEIVGTVLKRMAVMIQYHHLAVDIPADMPLIPVDFIQIEQVFTNLISNSAKYAPSDTTITIHARKLSDQFMLVQVINHGPPVPEESLERIFEKFYRVTEADKVMGTGLGLSICKGIVEAHGGRIWAENAPGSFIFNFTLPYTWEGATPQSPKEA